MAIYTNYGLRISFPLFSKTVICFFLVHRNQGRRGINAGASHGSEVKWWSRNTPGLTRTKLAAGHFVGFKEASFFFLLFFGHSIKGQLLPVRVRFHCTANSHSWIKHFMCKSMLNASFKMNWEVFWEKNAAGIFRVVLSSPPPRLGTVNVWH